MSSLAELKNETTLAGIALDPSAHHHHLLFAVVIDVSEATKMQEGANFNTKVKIIDPSFNYKTELKTPQLKFHKFVHVNVYSETPENAPKVTNVGDIIRLRRFRFKYTEKGEIMGNDMKYSNWLIYSGVPENKDVSISYKKFDKNINRKLTRDEANRVSDLRKWSEIFFGNNSLIYINWWAGFKELEDSGKGPAVYDKIDLILKVKQIESGKKFKIHFVDRDNKTFELGMNEKPSLKLNNVIKLRCVEITVTRGKELTRSLRLTKLSSCLIMPSFSSDYKQFDKAVQEQKRSPAKSTKTIDPFINDYQIEDLGPSKSSKSTPKKGPKGREERLVSAVKKIYNTKKVSTVEDLNKAMKSPNQHHGQKFLIKGHISDFSSTDPKEIIKFMHIDDRKIYNYGEKLDHIRKIRAIYNVILQVKDESSEDTDHPLNIYVLTGDFNTHLFTTWKILPEFDEMTAWANLKPNKLNEFQKKLESIRGADNSVRLIVELMITKKGTPFFKLVDTIFLA